MQVVRQTDVERKLAESWLSYKPDEDAPTAAAGVLTCDSCGKPRPKVVMIRAQTLCAACLKLAQELLAK